MGNDSNAKSYLSRKECGNQLVMSAIGKGERDNTCAEKLLSHFYMEHSEERSRGGNEQSVLVQQRFTEGDHKRYLEAQTEGP